MNFIVSFLPFQSVSSGLVYILQTMFSVVYPLFRSARIARGKECEENKIKLLKFW